jgi:nitrite reductase/ring-hydroxylating ferredoxin subunit
MPTETQAKSARSSTAFFLEVAGLTNTPRIPLIAVDDLAPGTIRRCLTPGYPAFAVYNLGGDIFVTEDNCTHGMASLSDGTLEGDVIECPFHGGAFNVRTGEPVEPPCLIPLKTFAPIIDDGVVYVEPGPPKAVKRKAG